MQIQQPSLKTTDGNAYRENVSFGRLNMSLLTVSVCFSEWCLVSPGIFDLKWPISIKYSSTKMFLVPTFLKLTVLSMTIFNEKILYHLYQITYHDKLSFLLLACFSEWCLVFPGIFDLKWPIRIKYSSTKMFLVPTFLKMTVLSVTIFNEKILYHLYQITYHDKLSFLLLACFSEWCLVSPGIFDLKWLISIKYLSK